MPVPEIRRTPLLPVLLAFPVLVGVALLLLPREALEPRLIAYAAARSPDGVVTDAGVAQMWAAVRLMGLAAVVLGTLFLAAELWTRRAERRAATGPDDAASPGVGPREATDLAPGRRTWLALAAITLVGALLRAVRLPLPLTYDEAFTLVNFVHPEAPWRAFLEYRTLNNHPFYSFLTACLAAPGLPEAWAGKAVAYAAGVATIPAVYLLVRPLGGVRPALVAAGLCALLPYLGEYGSMVRGYGLAVFLAAASLALAGRAARLGGRGRWAAAGAVMALAVGTHLFALPVVAGLLVGFVLTGRPALARGAMDAALVLAAGVLLVYGPVLHRVLFEIAAFTLFAETSGTAGGPWWTALATAGATLLGTHPGTGLLLAAAAVSAVPAAYEAVRAVRNRHPDTWLPYALAGAAIALPLLVLQARDRGYARFLLPGLPVLLLFWSLGLRSLDRARVGKAALVVGGAVLLAGWHVQLGTPRPSLRGFADRLTREAGAPDCLVGDWTVGDPAPYFMEREVTLDWAPLDPCLDHAREAGGRVLYACSGCEGLGPGGVFEERERTLLFRHDAGGASPFFLYRIDR